MGMATAVIFHAKIYRFVQLSWGMWKKNSKDIMLKMKAVWESCFSPEQNWLSLVSFAANKISGWDLQKWKCWWQGGSCRASGSVELHPVPWTNPSTHQLLVLCKMSGEITVSVPEFNKVICTFMEKEKKICHFCFDNSGSWDTVCSRGATERVSKVCSSLVQKLQKCAQK